MLKHKPAGGCPGRAAPAPPTRHHLGRTLAQLFPDFCRTLVLPEACPAARPSGHVRHRAALPAGPVRVRPVRSCSRTLRSIHRSSSPIPVTWLSGALGRADSGRAAGSDSLPRRSGNDLGERYVAPSRYRDETGSTGTHSAGKWEPPPHLHPHTHRLAPPCLAEACAPPLLAAPGLATSTACSSRCCCANDRHGLAPRATLLRSGQLISRGSSSVPSDLWCRPCPAVSDRGSQSRSRLKLSLAMLAMPISPPAHPNSSKQPLSARVGRPAGLPAAAAAPSPSHALPRAAPAWALPPGRGKCGCGRAAPRGCVGPGLPGRAPCLLTALFGRERRGGRRRAAGPQSGPHAGGDAHQRRQVGHPDAPGVERRTRRPEQQQPQQRQVRAQQAPAVAARPGQHHRRRGRMGRAGRGRAKVSG